MFEVPVILTSVLPETVAPLTRFKYTPMLLPLLLVLPVPVILMAPLVEDTAASRMPTPSRRPSGEKCMVLSICLYPLPGPPSGQPSKGAASVPTGQNNRRVSLPPLNRRRLSGENRSAHTS